ncbi:MAG TPA: hypothetical protein VK110_00485, partial [Salinisphaeraceae bacterium]|nr:hypothetical protein [Salinisphaeraceae bacterium]
MGVCARLVDGIALALFRVASVLLFLMMLIIMLEVIGRALFGATGGALDIALPGTIELVRHGLLFT